MPPRLTPTSNHTRPAFAAPLLAALVLLAGAHLAAGQEPVSHAERTGWAELTPHAEVIGFYEELAARSREVRIREFGRSAEGRQLLEVTLARTAVADPWEAHGSGKPIVLINAQVHGDEPAGKEALMLFARDVALGPLNHLLDEIILVLSPQLNPDGAEAGDWGSRNNLFRQNVNRDYLRLANPETRAFVQDVLAAWRPHVVVDAHELVGPPRIYDFYTSFPRYIEGPTLAYEVTRQELVPAIVDALEEAGFDHFPYHRVPGGLVDDPSQGVSAGSYGARALSSYGGAQAGITLLYESMRPRDAREGIENRTRRHHVAMTAMAEWVAANPLTVLDAVSTERTELVERGIRWDPADTVAIHLEQVASRELDYRMVWQGDTVAFPVPLLDSTIVEMGRVRPVGYLIDRDREELARHLSLHGVQVERLLHGTTVQAESYEVDGVDRASSVYEGYVPRSFRTEIQAGALEAPAGAFLVRMDQPEARIISHLMEPEDENSLAAMGFLATDEGAGSALPIHRLRELPRVPTEVVTGHDHRGAPVWRGGARAGFEEPGPPRLADLSRDELTPHTEVVRFFRELSASSPWVQMGEIGHSREDRPLHLVSLSRPAVKSPWEAHASGKPILFIGAQVHGDEPAGKEGLIQFATDLVDGPLEFLLDEMIFLFVPQQNPDGAEAGTWGRRANTAGYNLNRDWLRLDNPESRAIVQNAIVPWRPHVVVDAHELGGPPRVYDFYTWHPTNPHGPRSTMELSGDRLIPAIVEALEGAGYSHIIYHTPGGLAQLTSDPEIGIAVPVYGRTLNDYAASQGMATILFESLRESDARVQIADRATRQRVSMEALARAMAEGAGDVVAAVRDGRTEMVERGQSWDAADSIAVLREPVPSRRVEYMVAAREEVDTEQGTRWQFTDEVVTVETPVYDSSRVTLGRIRPEGYLIAPHRGDLVRELLAHGVIVEEVLEEATWSVEAFRVDSLSIASSVYEGYVPQRFRTTPQRETLDAPVGSYLVRAAQPGAALVFHLMEPEDENSLAITGAFLSEARPGATLPVHRVVEIPDVRVRRVTRR
jgi:murein tripeptide amidase MpaA